MEPARKNKKFNYIELDFKRTYSYFNEQLKYPNFLSNKIKKLINFELGEFFTILPDNANLERLYKFPSGYILPLKGIIREGNTIQEKISTTDEELCSFIYDFLNKNKSNVAIFDDVLTKPWDKLEKINKVNINSFEDEIYYSTQSNCPKKSVLEAITVSGNSWHFLCILTQNVKFDSIIKEDEFDTVCNNLKYIIVAAYDGEGFVGWKKLNEI